MGHGNYENEKHDNVKSLRHQERQQTMIRKAHFYSGVLKTLVFVTFKFTFIK